MLNCLILSNKSLDSQVTNQGNTLQIHGGAISNDGFNLFHSFQEFSVLVNQTAHFDNNSVIKNIFVCITGDTITNINGIVKANNNANIFFIDSDGIILDKNTALKDVGSFLATTAEKIVFADGAEFIIKDISEAPLSTVGVPVSLVTGKTTGSISVKSSSLQVSNGKTLALVGNGINLEDSSNLSAEDGSIEMLSVDFNSSVAIETIADSWTFGYKSTDRWQDINLNSSKTEANNIKIQGKRINLSGTSAIISRFKPENPALLSINAKKLIVKDSSKIEVRGTSKRDSLIINAAEYIELSALKRDVGIFNNPEDKNLKADAGNIDIVTKKLFVKNGAQINANVFFGSGNAGDIEIRASESIELVGRFLDSTNPLDRVNEIPSGLFMSTDKESTGNGGNLILKTEFLTIKDGAQIGNYSMKGNSGKMDIKATESILVSGTSPSTGFDLKSGIYASVLEGFGTVGTIAINTKNLTLGELATIAANNFGTGKGGIIDLNVNNLIVRNGGYIEAGTFADGDAGTLNINAKNSIEVSGIKDTFFINLDRTTSPISVESKLSTRSGIELDGFSGKGIAGTLTVSTPRLAVMDGAQIRADSVSSPSAGNINLDARTLSLSSTSIITASAKKGKGGKIKIDTTTQELSSLHPDKITAFGQNNDTAMNGVVNINIIS
jgi:filamentous hemagglutinin family protein